MEVNLKINEELEKNEILVEIQYSSKNKYFQHFVDYIKNYELDYRNKVIVLSDNYELVEVEYKEIIMFYSDKKYNYCKLKDRTYRVKNKLYELEEINADFIRISKNCIVNIKHVEMFDISKTGKIVVRLDDFTEQVVSRRKTKDIMKYLEDRRI